MTGLARQPGDLLVIGSGRRGALPRLGRRGGVRNCLANAHCPVLTPPPPSLTREAGHGLRGWAFRALASGMLGGRGYPAVYGTAQASYG